MHVQLRWGYWKYFFVMFLKKVSKTLQYHLEIYIANLVNFLYYMLYGFLNSC